MKKLVKEGLNEGAFVESDELEKLQLLIADIISNEVYTRNIPYSDDIDIDPDSINDAARQVVKELYDNGNLIIRN
jgi:hypothetical protein